MNYEQKYKEALMRARDYHDSLLQDEITDCGLVNELEHIFPELKESENERIREGLIKAFRTIGKKDWGGLIVSDILAWLEKQGEKESDPRYKYLEDLLTADDIYQMSVNGAMVEEAKTKAIEAISNMGIFELLGLRKQGQQKTLNADEVIEWIDEHVPTKFEDMANYVEDFKQYFGL